MADERLIADLPEKSRQEATEKLAYALIMRNEPKSDISPALVNALAVSKLAEKFTQAGADTKTGKL
jgi:hypothetical protein